MLKFCPYFMHRIRSLEAKCISLGKKKLNGEREKLCCNKNLTCLKRSCDGIRNKSLKAQNYLWLLDTYNSYGLQICRVGHWDMQLQWEAIKYNLLKELRVDGALLFDVDASCKILLIARIRRNTCSYRNKMSLVAPYERQDISLSSGTKAVRDLHICTSDCSLALFASLGKKLSVLSSESNNVILAYDLLAAACLCSRDRCSSHQIYAGQQVSTMSLFPCPDESGCSEESAVGICHWSFGGSEERLSKKLLVDCLRPFLVSETGNQGGSHVHLKRARSNYYKKLAVTCTNVNDVRLLRSTIMNIENHGCLFASRDELMGDLVLQELPPFTIHHLKSPKHPIHDVKYARLQGRFARLFENILQLFSNHALK
ncbi:hypothetical protein CRYUN_Cryun09bG0038000 [Craigia yunnanensis]